MSRFDLENLELTAYNYIPIYSSYVRSYKYIINTAPAAAPNFSEYPKENVTTLERGSLTFTCVAHDSSMRLRAFWYLSDGSTETSITTNKTLSDGTMTTVGSDYHSPLILSNINRVWNGATVHCAANAGALTNQPKPFPVISVWCELLQNIVYKLCYN